MFWKKGKESADLLKSLNVIARRLLGFIDAISEFSAGLENVKRELFPGYATRSPLSDGIVPNADTFSMKPTIVGRIEVLERRIRVLERCVFPPCIPPAKKKRPKKKTRG